MANHAVHGSCSRGITDGAAHAAALDVISQCLSPPPRPKPTLSNRFLLLVDAAAPAPNFYGRAAQKKSPAERGSHSAETGVLFRSFWSVGPGRVPEPTITLCHESGFSPTPKTLLLREGNRYQTGILPS